MKKVLYSACLLPILMYAGGEILPLDAQYDEVVNVPVEIVPPKKEVIKEEVKLPEVKPASKFYVGASAAYMNNSGTTSTIVMNDSNPYALIFKAGYNIIDNLAIEGRVGTGVKNENNIPSASVDNEFQNLWGVYLKPNIEVMDKVNLYALAGYAKTKQSINTTDVFANGFSYGAGIGYGISDNVDLVVDATRYADKTTSTIDAYTIGLDFKF